MRDEIDSRMWIEHHAAFSRSVGGLFGSLKAGLASLKPALERLHSLEWDAPWRHRGAGQA